MNENIAFEARKLKRRGAIHGYFTRDGVVHIKLGEHDKAIKILHKNHFCTYILDYEEEEWLDCYELFSCREQHLFYYEN